MNFDISPPNFHICIASMTEIVNYYRHKNTKHI